MNSAPPMHDPRRALHAEGAAHTEVAADSVHLAPPLPPPPADFRLLAAGLVVLGLALVLTCFSARRLRRPAAPAGTALDRALAELAAARDPVLCPCGGTVQAEHSVTDAQPCADRVRRALVEFAGSATGLPCANLTPQELRLAARDLPVELTTAVACITDVLDACDRCRFEPAHRYAGCLVSAAVAALRAWPAAAGVRGTASGEGVAA